MSKKAAICTISAISAVTATSLDAELNDLYSKWRLYSEDTVFSVSLANSFYFGNQIGRSNTKADDRKDLLSSEHRSITMITFKDKDMALSRRMGDFDEIIKPSTDTNSVWSAYTYKNTKVNFYQKFKNVHLTNSNLGDVVQVFYAIQNNSDITNTIGQQNIGLRMFLDTFTGAGESVNRAPFFLIYKDHVERVSGNISVKSTDMPTDIISASDLREDAGMHIIFNAAGADISAPDYLLFGEANDLVDKVPKYPELRFGEKKSKQQFKDSAMLIGWNNVLFKQQESRHASYLIAPYYYKSNEDVGDIIMAVTYYRINEGYRVIVGVQNKDTVSQIKGVTLKLEPGDYTTQNQSMVIMPDLAPGELHFAAFVVKPTKQNPKLSFNVSANTKNKSYLGVISAELK